MICSGVLGHSKRLDVPSEASPKFQRKMIGNLLSFM